MKSKPTSIRFDEEKLAFAKEQLKLKTSQAVVDRLLDNLWWRNHLNDEIKGQNPLTPDESYPEPSKAPEVPEKQQKNASGGKNRNLINVDNPDKKDKPEAERGVFMSDAIKKKLGL